MTDEERRARKNERARRYRQANPEKVRESQRLYRQANPDEVRQKGRERSRRYREANPERVRENGRRYSGTNPDKVRESWRRYRQANPEKVREATRRHREANHAEVRAAQMRRRHGPGIEEAYASLWQAQAGRCYMCEEPLPSRQKVHIDHDHSCCPPTKTCTYCRRGLACHTCNRLIGLAHDNPALLRKIADNFEGAAEVTRERIALKPIQGMLAIGE